MRRHVLPVLLAALALACAGCSGREPRFDLVPPPVSIRSIWAAANRDREHPLSLEQWHCLDGLQDSYLRNYLELVRNQATPLVREFRANHGDGWRRDAALIERYASRHAALLDSLETLDHAFLSSIEACGIAPALSDRLTIERQIECCRIVIEGHGPPVLDLRLLASNDSGTPLPDAAQSALDDYARQLAAVLPALRDAERRRPARHRRALDRLELDARRRAGGEIPEKEQEEIEREAEAESAAPVRRALGQVLDLDARTIDTLRALIPPESFEVLRERFMEATATGAGGTAGEPAIRWQVEVISAAQSITPEQRRTVVECLRRFDERDSLLATRLLETMRRGEPIALNDRLRADRDMLRTDLMGATLGVLPQAQRERLSNIGSVGAAEFDAIIREIAPQSADRLLARCPPGLRNAEPVADALPERPDSVGALFLPPPANEAWLDAMLARLNATTDERIVARQIWSDDVIVALKALEAPHQAVSEAERAIGESLRDPHRAGRAIDAYWSAIDVERRMIAAAEESLFDALVPVLNSVEAAEVEQLRMVRRIDREAIDWRFMFFSDGLGFSSESAVTAPAVIDAVPLDAGERAIANEVLRMNLPALVTEAAGFRSEGLATLRDVVMVISRAQGGNRSDDAVRDALPGIAASAKASVARHVALHRTSVDEVAGLLPERALELRRAWRRAAFPELFLAERRATQVVTLARRVAQDRPDTCALVDARLLQRVRALDDAEEAVLIERRAAQFESAPTSRDEIRDRLREWPDLAAAMAVAREVDARALRDLALLIDDPRLFREVNEWMRPARSAHFWIYE